MKTERARELYSDYAEGVLSPALQQALEQHFEADPQARADYEQFQRVCAVLDRPHAEEVEVPLGFRAKVLELAAEEQARREAAPARQAALSLTGWFQSLAFARQRRLTGGVLAALCVAALAAVLVRQVDTGQSEAGVLGSSFFSTTTIRSVSVLPAGGSGTTHLFHIHLPPAVRQATVMAYVVTALDQISDPAARQQQAMPALSRPQALTNDEELQIPVTLLRQAPAGTTLNLLVQWTPTDGRAPGAQVVFTPVQPGTAQTSGDAPVSGNFYNALEALAAQDNVTVVADASATPNTAITPPPASDTPQQALEYVARQVGYRVQPLDKSGATFQVTAPQATIGL